MSECPGVSHAVRFDLLPIPEHGAALISGRRSPPPSRHSSCRISHQETASLHQQQEDPTDLSRGKTAVSHTSREQGEKKNKTKQKRKKKSHLFPLMLAPCFNANRPAEESGHRLSHK